MKQIANVKEHMIEITTDLIKAYDGNTKRITARMITEKAGIGLGLINYHFTSKENLIDICVQRIIERVIIGADMNQKYTTEKEGLTAWAIDVFNFLFEHAAISRISILSDFQSYSVDCNSVRTQRGFMQLLKKQIADKDKSLLVFALTSAMQVAFLGSEAVKELLGYDFTKPKDRAAYIETLVSILWEDNRKEPEI